MVPLGWVCSRSGSSSGAQEKSFDTACIWRSGGVWKRFDLCVLAVRAARTMVGFANLALGLAEAPLCSAASLGAKSFAHACACEAAFTAGVFNLLAFGKIPNAGILSAPVAVALWLSSRQIQRLLFLVG